MSFKQALGLTTLICLGLSVAPLVHALAPACQIIEPSDKVQPGQEHQHHGGGHHMNIHMGEEKCGPTFTFAEGPKGPSHWPGVCTTGKSQSPVDIQHADKLRLSPLTFNYQPAELDMINDCNQYRVLVRFPDNYWLKVGKKPYFLTELHFKMPGENAVNGKRPTMSIQLVHLSAETGFLIIEVPVVAGKENPVIKTLWQHIPAPGKENKVAGVKINPMDLLPADRSFYRYYGSLSTPLCNEGELWYVMKNPIEMSEAQIAEYAKHYHDNARPLQPLNDRPVGESQ